MFSPFQPRLFVSDSKQVPLRCLIGSRSLRNKNRNASKGWLRNTCCQLVDCTPYLLVVSFVVSNFFFKVLYLSFLFQFVTSFSTILFLFAFPCFTICVLSILNVPSLKGLQLKGLKQIWNWNQWQTPSAPHPFLSFILVGISWVCPFFCSFRFLISRQLCLFFHHASPFHVFYFLPISTFEWFWMVCCNGSAAEFSKKLACQCWKSPESHPTLSLKINESQPS